MELSDSEIQTQFSNLISQSEQAFRVDPNYLIDMAEHAATIVDKRKGWEARHLAQQIESDARAQCHANPPEWCWNRSACGVDKCLFAKEEHKSIKTEDSGKGKIMFRPARSATVYRSQDLVTTLARKVR